MVRRDADAAARALELRVNRGPLPPGCLRIETVVVKRGPQAYKTASMLTFGDASTGEITKQELRVQSWNSSETGSGFDFTKTDNAWHCEDNEIGGLAAFLSGQLTEPGTYRRIEVGSPISTVVEHLENGTADAQQLVEIAGALASAPGAADVLANSGASRVLLDGVQAARQRQVVERLEVVIRDPVTREPAIQKELEGSWWMFGGRFIDKAKRRSITVLDQLDIPLIRADGALHIVELKVANVPQLVMRYRNHHIVGPEVNEAVGQAANYLRELDEQRHTIKATLGIECRRAFATVVIGHPLYVAGLSGEQINETLRTYNSHLSRIEVITYADLIAGAKQALLLGDTARAEP
jgi:hypothetical protein